MYRVLVLGGRGMVGHMVSLVLSSQRQFVVKSTSSGKLTNYIWLNIVDEFGSLKEILEKNGPFDYIINCIGILNSNVNKLDSKSFARTIIVNSYFPHKLAEIAHGMDAKVIHISTDGVFAQDMEECVENDPCNCNDTYGRTKELGEVVSSNYLNIRCSIIGPSPFYHRGLFEWFIGQPRNAKIKGFSNQAWNGVTTFQFAKLCSLIIKDNYFKIVRKEAPTHHFVPNQITTKYELLKLLNLFFRPDIIVNRTSILENASSRILGTSLKSINKIYDNDLPIKQVIEELSSQLGNQTK